MRTGETRDSGARKSKKRGERKLIVIVAIRIGCEHREDFKIRSKPTVGFFVVVGWVVFVGGVH